MSATLSADQLTWMRAISDASMPDLMDVQRGSSEVVTENGFTLTPNTVLDDVRCGYRAVTGQELESFGSVAEVGDYIVRCPANTDVRAEDTLVIAARAPAPSRTLHVKAVLHGSNEIATRILATEG